MRIQHNIMAMNAYRNYSNNTSALSKNLEKLSSGYQINRAGDDEIMDRWQNENGVTITNYDDMDIDSFKEAVDGVDEWYQNELESQGYEGAKDLIDTFTK